MPRRGRRERGDTTVMVMRLRCASATAVADRALDAEHAGRAASDRVHEIVDVVREVPSEEGGPCVHPDGERGSATGARLPRERGTEPRLGHEVAPVGGRRRHGTPRESEPPSQFPPIPPRPPRGGQATHRGESPQPRDHSEHVLSGPSGCLYPRCPCVEPRRVAVGATRNRGRARRTGPAGRPPSGSSVIRGRSWSPRASRRPRRPARARPEPATSPSRTSAVRRHGSGTPEPARTRSRAGDSIEGPEPGCP